MARVKMNQAKGNKKLSKKKMKKTKGGVMDIVLTFGKPSKKEGSKVSIL